MRIFLKNFALCPIDIKGKIGYNRRMDIYEHSKEFQIKYCDVDFKDELKVSSALAYMEEVACSSADELGFGYAYVKPRDYAFMVTNLYCEFVKPVPLAAKLTVKTWPTPPTHVSFGREYQFLSQEGETYMNATSRWCLIDRQTGKLLHSRTLEGQDYSTYNTRKLFDGVRWKLPSFLQEEGELRFVITIANSEYDHNMHVNNAKYADYCLNCFSVAELANAKLKKFAISYIAQCREGERISFYRKRQEDGSYLTQGFNEQGERVVQATIVLE